MTGPILPINIRRAVAADLPLILDSWLESAREEGTNRLMSNEVYFWIHRPRVMQLLRSTVLVASNPSDDWQVHGWLACSGNALHYAYTKRPFRMMRVASRLFEAAHLPRIATSTGPLFERVLRQKWRLTFDPRQAMQSGETK